MKIILVGYMASGKTSIGKKLSKMLNIPFYDLDDYIVEKEKLTITNIFKTKGEIYFRKIESNYLLELLNLNENFVLAVGGGTPCYGDNINIINNYGTSFYLKSSLKNTYKKLSKVKVKQKRPLIANISESKLEEFIAKHLFERATFYEMAQHTISIDGKSKKDISKEISLNIL